MIWYGAIPYFSASELACKGSGFVQLDLRFAAALPALRQEWGLPLTPTSVCRSPGHNRSVGGHPKSLHLTENSYHPTEGTLAADLLWPNEPLQFARLAYKRGWSIGLHDSFIHLDLRKSIGLPQAIFTYGSWSSRFNKEDIF